MAVSTFYQLNLVQNLTMPRGPSLSVADAVGLSNGGLAALSRGAGTLEPAKLDVLTSSLGDGGGVSNAGLLVGRSITQLTNGNLVIAGHDGNTNYSYTIVKPSGAVVLPVTEIIDPQTTFRPFFHIEAAALKNGGFVLVTTDDISFTRSNFEVDVRIFNKNGGLTGSLTLSTGTGNFPVDTSPFVATLNDGNFVVIWTDHRIDPTTGETTDTIWQTVISPQGTIVSPAVRALPNIDARGVSVVATQDGGYAVAYYKDAAAFPFVPAHYELARFAADGTLIGATLLTLPKSGVRESGGALTVLSNGFLAFTHTEQTESGGTLINSDVILSLIDPATGNVVGKHRVTAGEDPFADQFGGVLAGFGLGRVAAFVDGVGEALVGQRTSIGDGADDSVVGDDFLDSMLGGNGDDTLLGMKNKDTLDGENGDDVLSGGDGNDTLFGGNHNDSLDGGLGNDSMRGGTGDDSLVGGAGADKMFGDVGVDTLHGDAGKDQLFGGSENDDLNGGAGADKLNGEDGNDTMTGGTGNDRFEFRKGGDADVILDFVAGAGAGDVIRLIAFGAPFNSFAEVLAATSDVGGDAVIDLGGGDTITLVGVTKGQLAADDFIFG